MINGLIITVINNEAMINTQQHEKVPCFTKDCVSLAPSALFHKDEFVHYISFNGKHSCQVSGNIIRPTQATGLKETLSIATGTEGGSKNRLTCLLWPFISMKRTK